MPQRKLNLRQSRRIDRLQQRRVEDAWTPEDATRRGLVISRFGKQADIEDPGQPGVLLRCHIRANIDSLVAGDRIAWSPEGEAGVVLAREERLSALQRPDAQGRLRVVAANLDRLVVVVAPEPAPHPNLLDRYLVAAEDAGIEATILVNKFDLPGAAVLREGLRAYQHIGYTVVCASSRDPASIAALATLLAGHATAFVGQSGVGKSSLIAALLPGESLRIGSLSTAETKGRHTTTAARLYHLPQGGELIDSPGIREFSLAFLEPARIAAGFREFRPYLGRCRFRDCPHRDTPGCALREAVERGEVSAARLGSYLQIIGSPT